MADDHVVFLDQVVRKSGRFSRLEKFLLVKKLAHYLMENPSPTVVPILNFQDLGFSLEEGSYRYTYDMVRLRPLSMPEVKIVSHVVEMWHQVNDLPSDAKSETIVSGRIYFPKLLDFLETIILEKRYGDLHDGNVMLDSDYNYRLIDIEGFISSPGSSKHNWFLK